MINENMSATKVTVVLPAYNAFSTLEKTIQDIPFEYVDELILVDDGSSDDTILLAEKIKNTIETQFIIHRHDKNKGYGGNQKTCYSLALARGADIIVMLHPDYQYDPRIIKYFVEFIRDGHFDVMLGSRIRSREEALNGGMPIYKYFANRALSAWENLVTGRNLSEWHTGMRAYTRNVIEAIDWTNFSDDFIFDTQMLFSIIEKKYKIGDIPVPVRYFNDSSSINLHRSIIYGMQTIIESFRYLFRRLTTHG